LPTFATAQAERRSVKPWAGHPLLSQEGSKEDSVANVVA